MTGVRIVLADTVTRLAVDERGCVLISGSHGGVVAARYAGQAGVRAVVFNDAGIGLDDAGVAGLAWLEARGVAAAAVAHDSARIGDARDTLACGRISRANAPARDCGVVVGGPCSEAAECLRRAGCRGPLDDAFAPGEGRRVLRAAHGGDAAIVGLDSIGLVGDGDAGSVLVIGSHGALHGGDPGSALPVAARAAFFHDAGVGKDAAGITRLPVLDARGLPAATAGHRSARIGDARSMWVTGTLSRVNAAMRALGVAPGTSLRAAAQRLARTGAA